MRGEDATTNRTDDELIQEELNADAQALNQKSISLKNIHIFRPLLASHVPYLHTTRFQGEADKEIMAKLVRAVKTDLTNTRKVFSERKSRGSLSWSGGRWTLSRGGQTGAALVVVVVVG